MNATDEDVGDVLSFSLESTDPSGAPFTCDPNTGRVVDYICLTISEAYINPHSAGVDFRRLKLTPDFRRQTLDVRI